MIMLGQQQKHARRVVVERWEGCGWSIEHSFVLVQIFLKNEGGSYRLVSLTWIRLNAESSEKTGSPLEQSLV